MVPEFSPGHGGNFWVRFFNESLESLEKIEMIFPFPRASEKIIMNHFFLRFFEIKTLVNDCALVTGMTHNGWEGNPLDRK